MHVRSALNAHHVVPARVLTEVLLAGLGCLAYFLVRGLTESSFDTARDNAEALIRFERWLGVYHEEWVQSLVEDSDVLVNLVNWVYIWGHWPVIAVVGVWLVWAHPDKYRVVRNSFLISGAAGLVVFVLFPVAPPRLLDVGLIDTVTERSQAYRVLQPPVFVNQYAAMPSLHFGWDLLVGITLFRVANHLALRILGVLLPCAMAFAVVATANHFILDPVVGAVFALGGLWVASWFESRRFSFGGLLGRSRHET
ncbi:MAG: phosphatase PAP2 family protein [Dehalococcoidia bacterium]|nr:phosphatase PAP2 family protein [Dehalococcoidia bacterium]